MALQYVYIYIHYEYVLSLKMAFIAETCCCQLLVNKIVFRLNLYSFYLLVYLNTMGMSYLKKFTNICWHLKERTTSSNEFHRITLVCQEGIKAECCSGIISCLTCLSRLCCVTLSPFCLSKMWNLAILIRAIVDSTETIVRSCVAKDTYICVIYVL